MRSALLALVVIAIAGSLGAGERIMIGVAPEAVFVVTVDGEEVREDPVISGSDGIIEFNTGPGVICVSPAPSAGPAAVCSESPR